MSLQIYLLYKEINLISKFCVEGYFYSKKKMWENIYENESPSISPTYESLS